MCGIPSSSSLAQRVTQTEVHAGRMGSLHILILKYLYLLYILIYIFQFAIFIPFTVSREGMYVLVFSFAPLEPKGGILKAAECHTVKLHRKEK